MFPFGGRCPCTPLGLPRPLDPGLFSSFLFSLAIPRYAQCHTVCSDEDFAQTLDARRQKLNLPRTCETGEWEKLDGKILERLNALIGKSTLEHKLATYRDIVYTTCREAFGLK